MQAIDKPNLLRLLLKFGANPNLINNYGENALAQAYRQAKTEKDAKHLHKYRQTIEILKPITNMNERDKEGKTALQKAYFKPDKMLNLIELGCDVNIHNKEGRTPLMSATYPVQVASLKLLLEHGADPNLRGPQDKTALMIQFSNPEAVELLIKHGANPNLANHKGFTPLMSASINGYAEIVELLMKNGAAKSLNAKNDKGKTALDMAKDAAIRGLLKKSPN
jgi:serine/threonine-protein phosphatase 6 regulatory ankyrin repeat subunit B